jgi:ABC-type lipoprotein export system ATPase subunit
VLGLLSRLHADGQAVLLVTHDPAVAARADRVVRLRDGRVESAEDDAPDVAATASVPEQAAGVRALR